MTIDNLRCFILVAENLSFARAAEALYISQPAVTKQINALENELETSLFIRSTRHVELTSAGMIFYKDAKEIISKVENAVKNLQTQKHEMNSISIGLSNSTVLSYLSQVLLKLNSKYPYICPEIEVLSYKIVLNLFLEKKLDILFYYKENITSKNTIRFIELKKDHWSCVIPSNHALAERQSVSINDLKNQKIAACNPLNAPLAVAAFQQQLFEKQSFSAVSYCNTVEIAHCMVSAGMGIALLPSLLCPKTQEFSVIPIENTPALSFGVFCHKDNKSDTVKRFLEILAVDKQP